MTYTKDKMREYMRQYRAEHPDYCKRNTEQSMERKKADPEKWKAYHREYNKKYREKRKEKLCTK